MAALPLKRKVQNQAYHIVLLQLASVVSLAWITLALYGVMSGIAVLLGGLAYAMPNLLIVWWAFRYTGTSQAAQFAAALMAGELIKLFAGAILFICIVKYLPVGLLSVLIGFIGAIISFWVVSFWLFGVNR